MHAGRRGARVCAARIWGLDARGASGGWGVCCHSELDVRQPGLTLPLWAQGLVPKTRAGRKASCPPLGQTPSNVPSTVCLLRWPMPTSLQTGASLVLRSHLRLSEPPPAPHLPAHRHHLPSLLTNRTRARPCAPGTA